MTKKTISKTTSAFFLTLLPIVYIVCFLLFSFVATLLERWIEALDFFKIIPIAMFFLFPFALTGTSVASIVFQTSAIRRGESKTKNILMMILSVAYIVFAIVYLVSLWKGAMSV